MRASHVWSECDRDLDMEVIGPTSQRAYSMRTFVTETFMAGDAVIFLYRCIGIRRGFES